MELGAEPRSSSMVVANDQVIPVQFQGMVIAQLERPLGVENGTLHSQNRGPRLPGGTHKVPECCSSRPEAHDRNPSDW